MFEILLELLSLTPTIRKLFSTLKLAGTLGAMYYCQLH